MPLTESPFVTHRDILIDGDYSAAGFLQNFAMAMYAGAAYPLDASGLRNLDAKHMQAFIEMAAWYRQHGENDPDFVEVCKSIKARRATYALRIKAHLDELLASDPDQHEDGPDEHASSVRWYRNEHEANQRRGWAGWKHQAIEGLQMTKDEMREELERQAERFKSVYGGEVVTYAAQPEPDRKPWRKRKNLLDKAFEDEIAKAQREKDERATKA